MELLPLWLPILLASIAVWILSMILGMAFPHHKQDWIALPDSANPSASPGARSAEDSFIDYLRTSNIPPGNYLFPDFRDPKSMKTERIQAALNKGPVGHLSLWKTPLTMGDKMLGTFLVYLVATTLIAYLTRVALPASAATPPTFAKVFQIATTAGVLTHCFSFIPSALWWGSYKRTIIANIIDGLVFAAVTGAIFAWRWPH